MPIPVQKPFEKITAKDRAYKQIKSWIIDGTLEPNEKLGEVELAKAIAVSRTPIREALLKLNEDGFVKMEPGKITVVSEIDLDDIADLFEPMAVIEGLAASQVAAKLTKEQLHDLVSLESKYRNAIDTNKTQLILQTERDFHEQILKIADNSYEQQFSNMLYGHIERLENYLFKKLTLSDEQRADIFGIHDLLLKSLAEHNVARSSAAMTKDWLTIMRKLDAYLEDN